LALEALEHGTERETPGAHDRQDQLLFARADVRARERDGLLAHAVGVEAGSTAAAARACIAYSSESTSASQLASMMSSGAPIVPHVSSPSEASISTRVTAPVPLCSSMMRTL